MKNKSKKEKIKFLKIKTIRFSPEIEVEFPKKRVDPDALIKRNSVIKGWTIDSDGSLDKGCEYRPTLRNKLYWNENAFNQLKEILALIRCHGGKALPTCGLHIHVDCSKFTDKEVLRILTEWIHKQKYI